MSLQGSLGLKLLLLAASPAGQLLLKHGLTKLYGFSARKLKGRFKRRGKAKASSMAVRRRKQRRSR